MPPTPDTHLLPDQIPRSPRSDPVIRSLELVSSFIWLLGLVNDVRNVRGWMRSPDKGEEPDKEVGDGIVRDSMY